MTIDVSRGFHDRDKQFRTMVRQQGRIPTDAEETNAEEMLEWGHDTEYVETITPLGTPDDGFKVLLTPGVDDGFKVQPGSYYLGGARVENPAVCEYAEQVHDNWLTLDEPVVAGSRVVVWLEVEERTVTGVQDAELLDPALRGADGSARTRLCWRVRQAPTTEDTCAAAMAEVLPAGVVASLDPATGAIASTGTLTVGFDDTDIDLDLCKPASEAGYLGNRNNTFRIKRTRPGFFVWGEDNASQLYRVTVDADRRTIRFLTEPRDEYLRPRPGQTVELLRGDVLLPNFERVAELEGDLFRVTGGYQISSTPGARPSITVGSDVDATWLTWLAGSPIDPASPAGTPRHLYLRVWTGGGTAPAADVPFTAGTPQTLVGTGLTVAFDGLTLPGDGWTVSARPDAPTRVLPWALRDGMTAHGPRRHVAPLAIVDLATGEVHDCRERFRPLHRVRTCCTVTVGPAGTNVGDVDSIQAAIDLLPVEGGTVCLLAGEHAADAVVAGRRDVRFTGCPGRTVWVPRDPDEPLVTIIDSMGVGFSDIEFRSENAPAIVSDRADPSYDTVEHGGLVVADCSFLAPAGCAVLARRLSGGVLIRCRILAGPFRRAERLEDFASLPAIFLQGTDLVLERCQVRAARGIRDVPGQLALGGIQIGGGSEGVMIRDCLIQDGAGTGITLGSITFVQVRRDDLEADGESTLVDAITSHVKGKTGSVLEGWKAMVFGFRHVTGEAGCIGVELIDPEPGDDDVVDVPVSEGLVEDVEIRHNRILRMGSSGIATYPLGISPDGLVRDAVAVSELLVVDNLIADCVRFEVNVDDDVLRAYYPVGGVALAVAAGCTFRGNTIEHNGSDFGGGTCGIGIVYGEDITITDNWIEGNGIHDPERTVRGPNAGVHLGAVRAGVRGKGERLSGGGTPALSLHGNLVSQPAGRALRAVAIGPVMVDDNRLVGGNRSRLFAELLRAASHLTYAKGLRGSGSTMQLNRIEVILDLLGGDAVNLVNLAASTDLAILMRKSASSGIGFAGELAQTLAPSREAPAAFAATRGFSFGGPTQFHDNQVILHQPFPDGPPLTLCSILLASFDDVGFADNQCSIDPDVDFAVLDALVLATTARITSNRCQEAVPVIRSIAGLALLWMTAALNQTTRPILAAGLAETEVQLNLSD